MARIKDLDKLMQNDRLYVTFNSLPSNIKITSYALKKGLSINKLINDIYYTSFEWYGFLIGREDRPDLVVDIALGKNAINDHAFTRIESEDIESLRLSLEPGLFINGWIHSHADLGYKQFSGIDENNMITVLSYVASYLVVQKIIPLAKKELVINDLSLLVDGNYTKDDLKKGLITAMTDKEITKLKILEMIYGGFGYSIVVGDEGWHKHSIMYEKYGPISGTERTTKAANIELVKTDREFSKGDMIILRKEIKKNIGKPPINFLYGFVKQIKKYLNSGSADKLRDTQNKEDQQIGDAKIAAPANKHEHPGENGQGDRRMQQKICADKPKEENDDKDKKDNKEKPQQMPQESAESPKEDKIKKTENNENPDKEKKPEQKG